MVNQLKTHSFVHYPQSLVEYLRI